MTAYSAWYFGWGWLALTFVGLGVVVVCGVLDDRSKRASTLLLSATVVVFALMAIMALKGLHGGAP